MCGGCSRILFSRSQESIHAANCVSSSRGVSPRRAGGLPLPHPHLGASGLCGPRRAMALQVNSVYYTGPRVRPERSSSVDQLDFQQRRQMIASSLSFSDLISGHKVIGREAEPAEAAGAEQGGCGMAVEGMFKWW